MRAWSLNIIVLACIIGINIQGWTGHVLPVSYDQKTNQWNVLLGFNPNTGQWEDFWANPLGHESKASQTAERALKYQTNQQYQVSLQAAPWFHDKNAQQFIHFVVVPYIPGKTLYQTAQNKFRTDFAWMPIGNIQSGHHAGKKISQQTVSFIQNYWPYAVQKLSAGYQTVQQTHPTLPQVPFQAQSLASLKPLAIKHQPYPSVKSVARKSCQVIGCPVPWADGDQGHEYFYDDKIHQGNEYLGNFYLAYVTLNIAGHPITFVCAEAAFQAGKYLTIQNNQIVGYDRQVIQQLQAADGDTAFRIGQKNPATTPGWRSGFNVTWMNYVVASKFMQNAHIARKLKATGGKQLVEHSDRDDFWGVGKNNTGQNMLGKILMQVRAMLP
jgi:ribA/ribD-fused uncharacterized protein